MNRKPRAARKDRPSQKPSSRRSTRWFLAAAAQGDVAQLRREIEAGADVNEPGPLGFEPPLFVAAARGHLAAVKFLLAAGAKVDQPYWPESCESHEGATALAMACLHGHREIARLLLSAGADANANIDTSDGPTPLEYAVRGGRLEIVRDLLAAGASLNQGALGEAVTRGKLAVLQELLANKGKGAVPWGPIAVELAVPVQAADTERQLKVLDVILAAGADLEGVNTVGETAIFKAIGGRNPRVLKYLIDAGANVNMPHRWGVTPLHDAVMRRNLECVELLLRHGANVDAQDHQGRTPLHLVAESDACECARLLLAAGADHTCRDKSGDTPLAVAGEYKQREMAKLLQELESGRGAAVQTRVQRQRKPDR